MPQSGVLTIVDVAKAQLLAYNEKNWEKLRQSVTPGFLYNEVASGRKTQGVDEALQIFRAWANATSDSKGTINREYVIGNTVVLELTWNGTHTGPLDTPAGQIQPTGKKFSVPACQVIEVVGEKVSNVRHYFDMLSLLNQLGVLMK